MQSDGEEASTEYKGSGTHPHIVSAGCRNVVVFSKLCAFYGFGVNTLLCGSVRNTLVEIQR